MPWFKIGDEPGLRELKYQMLGLEPLKGYAARASVLDLGCAEGLVGKFMVDVWGVDWVDGIEVVPARVEKAREICAGYHNMEFHVGNFDAPDSLPELRSRYDIVLALAIAHKLKDPVGFIEWCAEKAEVLAIRLPTKHKTFQSPRSKNIVVNPSAILDGWELVSGQPGPRNEWTGIWCRP